ncbi:carbohydrate sulfotransferase 15-like [Pomacea canaliculata]|uniref:carbohydrate sulfotransferase 15-like n=1 Tax=Pomacea canaliculata TaxID=400727 RepID=UPI000D733079|nr:carbohydrate sulfotransferase 15-like [Pomacea canaliculata]
MKRVGTFTYIRIFLFSIMTGLVLFILVSIKSTSVQTNRLTVEEEWPQTTTESMEDSLVTATKKFHYPTNPPSAPKRPDDQPSRKNAFRQPEENVTQKPEKIKLGYSYPEWYLRSCQRSITYHTKDEFVGDRPFFPPCAAQTTGNRKGFYPMIEPKRYLPNSKNPCWIDKPGDVRTLRCIPYFYVAGVAKCGTSDLFRRIRLHPEVMKGTMKEYHWWDRTRFGFTDEEEEVTFRQYTMQVTGDNGLESVLKDLRTNGSSRRLFGDGSPSYVRDLDGWPQIDGNQGCLEPRVTIGQQIRHLYPDAKIIIILRHPTPRLYSRFLSRIPRTPDFKDATSKSFHEYVVRAVRLYRECFDRWSLRHCAYNGTLYAEAVTRVSEGLYSVFLEDWLRIFPRKQMLILRYEDYARDMETELMKVFDFLGTASMTKEEKDVVMEHVTVNVGDLYEKLGPMLPETISVLNEFYEPFNQQLAQLLDDEQFLWRDITP